MSAESEMSFEVNVAPRCYCRALLTFKWSTLTIDGEQVRSVTCHCVKCDMRGMRGEGPMVAGYGRTIAAARADREENLKNF